MRLRVVSYQTGFVSSTPLVLLSSQSISQIDLFLSDRLRLVPIIIRQHSAIDHSSHCASPSAGSFPKKLHRSLPFACRVCWRRWSWMHLYVCRFIRCRIGHFTKASCLDYLERGCLSIKHNSSFQASCISLPFFKMWRCFPFLLISFRRSLQCSPQKTSCCSFARRACQRSHFARQETSLGGILSGVKTRTAGYSCVSSKNLTASFTSYMKSNKHATTFSQQ